MDEGEAVQRLKRSDLSGLEWLVRRHQVEALRVAYLITRDAQAAQDIVQDAFLSACRHIAGFDEGRRFAPWFLRIVINASIKSLRGANRFSSLEPEGTELDPPALLRSLDPSPEDQAESARVRRKVWEALERLSPRQRAAIVLRYYLGMSEKEMSAEMAAPPGTVKWLLNAARQSLRSLLGTERDRP